VTDIFDRRVGSSLCVFARYFDCTGIKVNREKVISKKAAQPHSRRSRPGRHGGEGELELGAAVGLGVGEGMDNALGKADESALSVS
jgi:hypothetical protein